MKRITLIAMLVLLPYHFSWATISLYCDHHHAEQTAGHFGHHSHAQDLLHGATDHQSPQSTDLDLNADHEHYGNALALAAALPPTSIGLSSDYVKSPLPLTHDTADAEPERPNWIAT